MRLIFTFGLMLSLLPSVVLAEPTAVPTNQQKNVAAPAVADVQAQPVFAEIKDGEKIWVIEEGAAATTEYVSCTAHEKTNVGAPIKLDGLSIRIDLDKANEAGAINSSATLSMIAPLELETYQKAIMFDDKSAIKGQRRQQKIAQRFALQELKDQLKATKQITFAYADKLTKISTDLASRLLTKLDECAQLKPASK